MPSLPLFGCKNSLTHPYARDKTQRDESSWLGERDRFGRRGQRLADRIPPLLYNFLSRPSGAKRILHRAAFSQESYMGLLYTCDGRSVGLLSPRVRGEPEIDFPETIRALNP